MKTAKLPLAASAVIATLLVPMPAAHAGGLPNAVPRMDPHLREITYDPNAVVPVPVQRGVVTLIVLDEGESLLEVSAGIGSDCKNPDMPWCISYEKGDRHIFAKPKTGANGPNNLAVITSKRIHSFQLVPVTEGSGRTPLYRLTIKAPPPRPAAAPQPAVAAFQPLPLLPAGPRPEEVVAERLNAAPKVVNAKYSIAEGKDSADIVPTLIFDDGRFTYFRFPNNREVPMVFNVRDDGSENVVNVQMEGDLLVADRVSRRMVLRSGMAVVGVWNDAFDIDGVPPVDGTTVPGVRRVLKAERVNAAPALPAAVGGKE